ncbi:hypothetical protein HanXRQr2_Chr03g0121951 [Helianthus annuus]|uniref:Uncharacterized protein n=1 Tax=Helianthus annuus TaxID=4232 RepID=A0A9K3JIX8_HELAN|nr:hypothetical protein HanXRQr2_Chr03g0121951 [Helianthus annuus]
MHVIRVNPNYARYLHNYARSIGGRIPSHVKSLLYFKLTLDRYVMQ